MIEAAGYGTAQDLWAYVHHSYELFRPDNPFPEKMERVMNKVRERYGLTVRNANLKDLEHEMMRLKKIYNAAWERNWGFVPVTDAEMQHLAQGIVRFVDQDLVFFVEKDEEPIAFGLTLPDVNIPVQKANGRLFPIGWLRYLLAKRKIDWVRVFALGVIPEYRGKGIDSLLYFETAKAAMRKGYYHAECSWILSSNDKMNQALQNMGARVYKTYRVYEKPLAER